MFHLVNRLIALGAISLTAICASAALAQSAAKPEPPVDRSGDGVSRYCGNVAPIAGEARIAWETKRLTELDGQVRQRISELDAKEAEARDWVAKRETMMSAATQDVVSIYGKMDPEAASAQLAAMDESMAAAILGKLKPNAASAILNEMDAAKAGKLTGVMSGAASAILPAGAPAASATAPEKKS